MRNWTWLVFLMLFLLALGSGRLQQQPLVAGNIPGSWSMTPVDNEAREWQELINKYDGFSLNYPADWQLEIIPGVATILAKPGYAKLSIFAQPLGKISAEEYVLYSNRSLQEGWGSIKLQGQQLLNIRGYHAWRFEWTRQQLGAGDLNYYFEYDLVAGKTVYTFMLKSNQANFTAAVRDLNRIIQSFNPLPPQGVPALPAAPPVQRDIAIEGRRHRLVIPADKTMWGILNPHKLGRLEYFEKLLPLEKELDFKFQFLITYAAFDTRFNFEELKKIYDDNRVLMVALQPWWYGKKDDTSLIDLIQGKYDNILREWARQFKALEDPVFVRFGNEMNGDWSTWSAWYYGKDTDIFKMAWEHVYRLFKAEGANNVLFVFNPHDRSFPNFKWNNYLLYYPGDQTVDWIGLTGYNNGTSHAADTWRGFNEIYEPLYREYMHYFGKKPFMITEFSSNEVGGDKAAWIRECFRSLALRYPNIKIAVWFNQVDGKWLYNLDSSPRSQAAFKEGLQDPHYRFQAVIPR
ncbi:glycoside hydrolase family 26 protein [Neomoorella carbonis]|uniref:glycoside hydrolase family 26 protein n=1 Tax=Neomoorella carbonis TaxID=3062783 RepID=UPI003252520C